MHVYRPAWRQPGKVWKGRTRVRVDHSKVRPIRGRAATPVWALHQLEDNKQGSQVKLLPGKISKGTNAKRHRFPPGSSWSVCKKAFVI